MGNMFNKENYELAKKNGLLDRFRGDEISRRLGEETPSNAQVALLMNTVMQLLTGVYDLTEWNEYQERRAKAKAEVDLEIIAFETNTNIYHGA